MDAGSEGQDHRREHGAAGERLGYRAPERYSAAAALRLAPGSAGADGIGRRAGLCSGDGRGAESAGNSAEIRINIKGMTIRIPEGTTADHIERVLLAVQVST